jgi:predicted permease
MDSLWQDVRLAGRSYARQPGFTFVAMLILALGVGANTAIYTLVEAVALRSLPVTRPTELYRLGDNSNCCVRSGLQGDFSLFSDALYQRFRDETPEFSSLAAFQASPVPFSVRRSGGTSAPRLLVGEFVSGNYFATLGVPLAAGRGLTDGDDRAAAAPVAVLSYRAWRDRYGLDPAIVGATLIVSGRPVTVVGVASPAFFGETLRANPPDFWLPLGSEPTIQVVGQGIATASGRATSLLARADQHWLYVIGRLRAGVTPSAVEGRVSSTLRSWLAAQPDLSSDDRALLPQQHVVITEAGTGISTLRSRYADALRVLAVVSALVLLAACANLANLFLARAQPFQFAMRAALGASRRRLVQQMLVGGAVLAVAGGAAGVGVAYVGTRAIVAMAFRGATFVPVDVAPSGTILGFAALASLFAGVVFTAVPAWLMSKAHPMDALRGGGRSTADRSALPRQGLVVLQVAISLVLLVGASLLTVSLRRLENQNFGFLTDGRMTVKIDPSLAGYAVERLPSLYDRLYADLPRVPGVMSVSLSQYGPMEGNNWSGPISLERRSADAAHHYSASWLRVGPGYFETIGTRVLRGRAIDARDTASSLRVAVVNRTFAEQFFPSDDPIGRHLGLGEESGYAHAMDYEIVGIVDDAKYLRADEPAWATFFIPLLQTVPYGVEGLVSMQARSLFIHDIELRIAGGAGGPVNLEADVRRTLAAIDPNLTVNAMVTLDEQLERNFNQQRLIARLTSLYGWLALLLAAVGLYGVTSDHVARRTAEIGIRMALGADRQRVITMVLRRALLQAALGLAIGLPIVFVEGAVLSSQLYGVTSRDPLVLSLAVVVLGVSALVAAFVPALRAASIDPIKALRAE